MPMFLPEALDRVQTRLQSPYGAHWQEQEAVFAVTEALRVWQALTGELTGDLDVDVAAGTVWLTVPRYFVTVQHIAINGRPLVQYTTSELDAEFEDWEAASGTTTCWAPEGAALLALYPAPSANVTLTITGVLDIPIQTTGSLIDLDDSEMSQIIHYAHSPYLTFKEAPPELETESLSVMAAAAGGKNADLRKSDFYRRYAGMDRVMGQGQEGNTKLGGESTLGLRNA